MKPNLKKQTSVKRAVPAPPSTEFKETMLLLMERIIEAQEKRDTLQHERNLEMLDKGIKASVVAEKSKISIMQAIARTDSLTKIALSDLPGLSRPDLERFFKEVVTPTSRQIHYASEYAAPESEEGFWEIFNEAGL